MRAPVLDRDLLQAFVAVADHRSFTRAAAALNRTQSAISMQVKRLEERLQAELFHRSTSSVELERGRRGTARLRPPHPEPERGSGRPGARARHATVGSAWA